MAQRTRRANAGNRLQSLLAGQAPMDEADAEYFAERDDDEDFDLEAEEERLRQERRHAERERERERAESGDDGDGSGDDDDGSGSSGADVSGDDENFSSSTDDSDSDKDEQPQDAGEKELVQEQRQRTRNQRVAERNKMFKIKRRAPPGDAPQAPRPKKKRLFNSEDILLDKGRHSERKSALRNKKHLIEQMREAEERRAQYVPPKRTAAPKLTQAQRLEEAKKTELRNLSSLNKFVELEEERRYQQRLAMISRRPKLTHFIRFRSAQCLAPPKLMEVLGKEPKGEDDLADEPGSHGPSRAGTPALAETGAQISGTDATKGSADGPGDSDRVGDLQSVKREEESSTARADSPDKSPEKSPEKSPHKSPNKFPDETLPSEGTAASTRRPESDAAVPGEGGTAPSLSRPASASPALNVDTKPTNGNESAQDSPQPAEPAVSGNGPASLGEKLSREGLPKDSSNTPLAGSSSAARDVKSEPALDADGVASAALPKSDLPRDDQTSPEERAEDAVKAEVDGDAAVISEQGSEPPALVYGPAHLRTYDFLTLHEFADTHINKYSIRSIILGPIASAHQAQPLKRMCPFSGEEARYRDPTTDVAYRDLETSRLIKAVQANKLCWSKEMGGVFLSGGHTQRHAKGVPEGFA